MLTLRLTLRLTLANSSGSVYGNVKESLTGIQKIGVPSKNMESSTNGLLAKGLNFFIMQVVSSCLSRNSSCTKRFDSALLFWTREGFVR